jgi:hypothetical protein
MTLNEIGNNLVNDLRQKLKSFDDTGKTSNSLSHTSGENFLEINGLKSIEYLVRGSGVWRNPENYRKLGYILDITGWAERRGMNPYAVAYVIAHEGNQVFRGLRKGLDLTSVIESGTKQIMKAMGEDVTVRVKSEIDKLLKV